MQNKVSDKLNWQEKKTDGKERKEEKTGDKWENNEEERDGKQWGGRVEEEGGRRL